MSKENDIQRSVLEKIRRGEVSMRPRYFFVLRIIGISIVAALALACSIFALSFVSFAVHESGEQFLLGFGTRGLGAFVELFPWFTLILSIVLLVVLEALLRNFKFGYRLPLLRIFLWALVIAVVGSILVSFTPLNTVLLDRADQDTLPILGPLYEQLHDSHQPQGVYRGMVTSFTGTGFVISYNDHDRDSDDGSWTISPPAGFATSTLTVGENVYVAGVLMHNVVYAYGIRALGDNQ